LATIRPSSRVLSEEFPMLAEALASRPIVDARSN